MKVCDAISFIDASHRHTRLPHWQTKWANNTALYVVMISVLFTVQYGIRRGLFIDAELIAVFRVRKKKAWQPSCAHPLPQAHPAQVGTPDHSML